MKYCKHYLLFLLAGALLLLPVTSHYAISWEEIKKKARTFVSDDTLQKTIPGAIVAIGVAGALYYWWTKKIENPIRSIVPKGYVWSEPQQFNVYSQTNYDGGGAASCGYHTLLRGMQIVEAKARGESDENLQEILKGSDLIDEYFGQNGTWRQAIIQKKPLDDRHGDWIDDGDLEYLWNNYKKNIFGRVINCGFLAIPNFRILGTEFSLLEPYIKNQVRPFLNEHMEMFHIFALGTMHQSGDRGRTEGHWYPLVMYQNKEGKRTYYITDSWNNKDRTHDVNALKIIELIEQ